MWEAGEPTFCPLSQETSSGHNTTLPGLVSCQFVVTLVCTLLFYPEGDLGTWHVGETSISKSSMLNQMLEEYFNMKVNLFRQKFFSFISGYVTELLLTLEAAVDSLESDFRPLDFMKDFFKSTPNLNNKECIAYKRSANGNIIPRDVMPSFPYLNQGHARSTSYSVSYCARKQSGSPANDSKDLRGRGGADADNRAACNMSKFCSNLSRSRSAQSLKLLGDSATQDDKLTILAQLFWLSVSLLESDYEHEFLLALRLLARVLHRLPLDRPDARDKVEKLQSQLRWSSFPGVHALLLKVSRICMVINM